MWHLSLQDLKITFVELDKDFCCSVIHVQEVFLTPCWGFSFIVWQIGKRQGSVHWLGPENTMDDGESSALDGAEDIQLRKHHQEDLSLYSHLFQQQEGRLVTCNVQFGGCRGLFLWPGLDGGAWRPASSGCGGLHQPLDGDVFPAVSTDKEKEFWSLHLRKGFNQTLGWGEWGCKSDLEMDWPPLSVFYLTTSGP